MLAISPLVPVQALSMEQPLLVVQSASGKPGEEAIVQVLLREPAQLKTLRFKLRYDPFLLELNESNVRQGGDVGAGWLYASKVEPDQGTVHIGAVSTKGFLTNQDAVIATLSFGIRAQAKAGPARVTIETVEAYYDVAKPAPIQTSSGRIDIMSTTSPVNMPILKGESVIEVDEASRTVHLVQHVRAHNGTVETVITLSDMRRLIDEAKKLALTSHASSKITVRIEAVVSAEEMVKKAVVTLHTGILEELVSLQGIQVLLATPLGQIALDHEAWHSISKQASGDLRLQLEQIASRSVLDALVHDSGRIDAKGWPAYGFEMTSDSGAITSLMGGEMTVMLSYERTDNEHPSKIVAYVLDEAGQWRLVKGHYLDEAGSFWLLLSNMSPIKMGYVDIQFLDVSEGDWFHDAAAFLGARGITDGVGEQRFAPYATVTRGQFIKLLLDAYGIMPRGSGDNFEDAGNTWYSGYLASAKQLQLSDGVGHNRFAPEKPISRQEMFTLAYRMLQQLEELPALQDDGPLKFKDDYALAPWAEEAVTYLAAAGVVTGDGQNVKPQGLSSRAELAQFVYRLLRS